MKSMKFKEGDIVIDKVMEWRGQIIGKGKEKDWKVRFRKGQKDEYEERECNEYELWSEEEFKEHTPKPIVVEKPKEERWEDNII